MMYLTDTNVLLRSIQSTHHLQPIAERATTYLVDQGHRLSITSQNIIEFWAVATRPLTNNGLGLSTAETTEHVGTMKRVFRLLPDSDDIYGEWERLVEFYDVKGLKVYDARLVAAMNVHGIKNLLTFNTEDFKRYNTITVVNPTTL